MGHLLSFDNRTERAQWFTRARHQRQSRRTDRPRWRRRGGISGVDCEHPPGRELDYGTQREQRVTGARHKGQSRPVQWTSRNHGQYIARVGAERKLLQGRQDDGLYGPTAVVASGSKLWVLNTNSVTELKTSDGSLVRVIK